MKILSKQYFLNYMLDPFGPNGLTPKEKKQAFVSSVAIGILSLGIVHGICALISRRTQKGKENPKITTIQQQHLQKNDSPLSQAPSKSSRELKSQFEQQIVSTMGPHIRPAQKEVLLRLFDESVGTPNPRQNFEQLIEREIANNVWGTDKAQHIKKNLLILIPEGMPQKVTGQNDGLINQVKSIAQTEGVVCFYKKGPTEFLGNFAICPNGIKIWGKSFKCTEAAFQWKKYSLAGLNEAELKEFFTCNGEEAFNLRKKLDAKYPNVFPKGWKTGVRDTVMWEVLCEKFKQNPELKQLLDATRGAYLLEHNERAGRDTYWSDDYTGQGLNMLGKMLAAIRESKPCPPPDDNSDQSLRTTFSAKANQGLNYQIF